MNYFLFAAALLVLIDLVICAVLLRKGFALLRKLSKKHKKTPPDLSDGVFRFALRRRLSLCGAGRDASFRSAFQSVSGCGVL